MHIRSLNIILFLLLIPGLAGCKKNHYKVNVTSVRATVEIKRLEKDLFTLEPDEIAAKVPELKSDYGSFLKLFSYVINAGDINDSGFTDLIVSFCTDRQNNGVYAQTMKIFPDLVAVENELQDAFRHYLYYFPDRKVPKIYSCITGFNSSIITGDSVLGIGLDRYLGADCAFYPQLEIYSYISARMTPDYIAPDCMYAWATSEWDYSTMNYPAQNVLAEIIHEGKLKYFERCMIPGLSDEVIFGFTPGQMKFCRNNEGQMWQYLVENDLVFKTDQFIIRKLIGEAPFTSYFTNESPGRAAVWIGFRIVEAYMKKNPAISLSDLMNNTDIQGILGKARYSPKTP